jgi:HD-like signal output (HDOD) protein
MKKRILFVDDEPMVLQGLQRMLRPMRNEWDMEFAEGGEKAKAALLTAACDVVVTDMRMPGMDGAALLEFTREHSPKTIRLVLSGHAEQDLAIKCVGLAHQYLSKPCDAETLRKTIARVTELGFAGRNERVMTLVANLKHLPSIPTVYSQIVRLLNDPDCSMADVGALIASDMAMTAKILQLVNSSFFGLARSISKPSEAASFLGINTLKTLALATGVFAQFEVKMPRGFSATAASDHSQRVGTAARAIAQCEQCLKAVVDQSLVAGLLHDVGKLVLASSLPEEFQRTFDHEALNPLDAESEIFGATHAEVGGYLLGLWGLPPSVVEAISLHHAPRESGNTEFSALTAVHVADCLIAGQSADANASPHAIIDTEYLAGLGLADRLPAWCDAVDEISASPAHCN